MGIWSALREDPATVKHWYAERWETYTGAADRVAAYERIRDAYNAHPNYPADFLFISRSCYGGVIRFPQAGRLLLHPVRTAPAHSSRLLQRTGR